MVRINFLFIIELSFSAFNLYFDKKKTEYIKYVFPFTYDSIFKINF